MQPSPPNNNPPVQIEVYGTVGTERRNPGNPSDPLKIDANQLA